MNHLAIDTHRSLLYVLFAIFETLLLGGAVALWLVDPRRMSGLEEAAGITVCFSLLGLSTVSWLLRRVAHRLAQVGWISVLAGFVTCALLPGVA
jgi:hypothetical protein